MSIPNCPSFISRRRHCCLKLHISLSLLSALVFVSFARGVHSTMDADETDIKLRIRHLGTDLSLAVVDGSVIAAKYNPNPSFWWYTFQDIGGKVGFQNIGAGKKTLTIPSGVQDAQTVVVSENALHAEMTWLFAEDGGIYNMAYLYKDVRKSLHVPKDAKPGDQVQLSSDDQGDAFVLEPVPKSGEPARLTVEESWNRHLEQYRPPPGALN